MRYKFRAWLKQEKKIVVPYAINFEERVVFFDEKYENVERFERIRIVSFDEIELMEYIGKSDVHDVEICVGDIVKVHYEYESYDGYVEGSTLCVVEYVDEWCRVIFHYLEDKDGNYYSVEDLDMNDVEIVGNIYENKELLENE